MLIAKSNHGDDIRLLPQMANRHGLITGATGTGKTVTLQKIAESFANIGVPVFMADIKGDLGGISQLGDGNPKLMERLAKIGVTDWTPSKCSVEMWDVFGDRGNRVRCTVSELGPLLLARLLNLTDVQAGVLQIIFKFADDNGLLLLDLKDLRAMTQYIGDNASEIKLEYGNVTSASIGAIQRGLLQLEQEGAADFLGEPTLEITDLMKTDANGKGIVNILACEKLFQLPKLYSMILLWLLSEIYEELPEVGDLDKPKMVFFFDEAHTLFNDVPDALLLKIEQVVRLIRSKGVGVYFISQNPADIADTVLGQLGNRVQHALRAYTPKDLKGVKTAAETMRANPEFDSEEAIQALGTGEALISFLDAKGTPQIVQKCSVIAPSSRMGLATAEEMNKIRAASLLATKYNKELDRESAYERLMATATKEANADNDDNTPQAKSGGGLSDLFAGGLKGILLGSTGPRGGKKNGLLQKTVESATSRIGREIVRGVLGSILKRK